MHRIPKVRYQICGEERRQVLTDVYANICAVRNQTIESKDVVTDNLKKFESLDRFAKVIRRTDYTMTSMGVGSQTRYE